VTTSSVDGSTAYQYDAASQVTAATHTSQASESYQYDANGNRTNTGTSTGGNNRLLSDDRYDYQYDAEGNRTRRTERATGKSEVLAWDHRNRLTSVTTFSATGTKLATAEYTYDVFDRRIARRVDADGNGVFETTQRFVYDGEDLILAFSGSTNVLTNRYLYGPATDEILADEKITTGTAGTVTWSLGDNLGTIRDLVQYNAATGTTTVVNHVRYDTFGQIVGQTNSQFQPWFAYTGREWDPAVGLYFYRARWYDPRAGRFTSEDPLGFAAGDVNLSRYVGNGPTLWVDPSGETLITPGLGVGAGAVAGAVTGAVTSGLVYTGMGLFGHGFSLGGLAGSVTGGAVAGAVTGAVVAGTATADPATVLVLGGVAAVAGGAAGGAMGSSIRQIVDNRDRPLIERCQKPLEMSPCAFNRNVP
jgi:RHS repeat-associated protein